jgi:hypothetical protein
VFGYAQVSGDAHVSGDACVYDDAQVSGNACVYGDARVFGDAHVSGNARVSDNACVYGDARVSGYAHVSGYACVYDDAWEKSPLYINLTKWSLTVSTRTIITIGCNSFTVQEWEEKADAIAEKEYMSKSEIKEYKMAIQYAKNWMEIYCK